MTTRALIAGMILVTEAVAAQAGRSSAPRPRDEDAPPSSTYYPYGHHASPMGPYYLRASYPYGYRGPRGYPYYPYAQGRHYHTPGSYRGGPLQQRGLGPSYPGHRGYGTRGGPRR